VLFSILGAVDLHRVWAKARDVLLVVLCAMAAGCGSGANAGSPSGPVSAGQADAANAQINRFRALPAFVPPGPAFHASSRLRGKTIFEIPITSEVPFIAAVEAGMRDAAARVGARVVTYPNQGSPNEWAQGIRTAIAEHAAAITLLAQDPRLLAPQIAEARRAGIPVVVARTTGEGEPCQADGGGHPYGSACVPGPFEQAGRLEADWVAASGRGRADVLVVTSNDARSTVPLVRGLMDEFRVRCPACDLRFVDVPIPRWAGQLRSEVQSALVRDPGLNYVIPIYDSMSQYVVPALRGQGAANRVGIATFNGTPFVLKLLQDGEVVRMDAGENLAWIGWAIMDQTFRVVAGVRPVRSEHTALRVFDRGDVLQAGTPPGVDQGYGNAYVAGYERLWGTRR
jgi:ribose transport system substrate-binding protein